MSQFDYFGTTLNRFDHIYNSTYFNERGVEIAVAQHWLNEYYWNEDMPGDALEVGNVTSHYDLTWVHHVVDKYEPGQRWFPNLVKNLDVFDIKGEYSLIMSISTLEHVGYDPPENVDVTATSRAIDHLRSLLFSYGRLCVTMPYQRPDLDFARFDTIRDQTYIRQLTGKGWETNWIPVDQVPDDCPPYGTPTPWANAVWVAEFGPL